jgi:hypothetical protein
MRSIRFSLLALGAVALLGLAAGSGQAQVAVLNPLVHQPPFAPSYVTPLSSYVAGYGIPQSPFRRSTYFGQYNAETVSYVRPIPVRSDLQATAINLRAAIADPWRPYGVPFGTAYANVGGYFNTLGYYNTIPYYLGGAYLNASPYYFAPAAYYTTSALVSPVPINAAADTLEEYPYKSLVVVPTDGVLHNPATSPLVYRGP